MRKKHTRQGTHGAGIGYCPSYRQREELRRSRDYDEAIRTEVFTGRNAKTNKPIPVDPVDVFRCVLSDADALDYGSFEEWASNYGFDTDSRKAEAMYRACVDTGLALRARLGDGLLQELRELGVQM